MNQSTKKKTRRKVSAKTATAHARLTELAKAGALSTGETEYLRRQLGAESVRADARRTVAEAHRRFSTGEDVGPICPEVYIPPPPPPKKNYTGPGRTLSRAAVSDRRRMSFRLAISDYPPSEYEYYTAKTLACKETAEPTGS